MPKSKGKQTRLTREVVDESRLIPAKHKPAIVAEVDRILRTEGSIRLSRLLELAADPSNPFHAVAYKDSQGEAARKWRVMLLRRVLRSLRVVYTDDEGEEVASTRALVSVVTQEKTGERIVQTRRYISIEQAFADPGVRKQMLDDALSEADRWRERHRHLTELRPIFDAINAARKAKGER